MRQGECDSSGVLAAAGRDSDSVLVVCREEVSIFTLGGREEQEGGVRVAAAGGTGYTVKCSRWGLEASLPCQSLAHLTSLAWSGGCLVAADLTQPAIVLLREQDGRLEPVQRIPCPAPVWMVCGAPEGAVVQLEGGALLDLRWEGWSEASLAAREAFPGQCDPMLVTGEGGVLGLTARHALVLGPRPLLEGVTSLALHSHYLLATTREHRLLALALASLGEAREGQDQGRKVERGSRLVCAVPHNSRTVLQMPRGNLEVVQPRALSVRMVAELLDSASYAEAFLLARRQRMNLNLLVDHDRAAFTAGVPAFVSQLRERGDFLNIFLADLAEEDVCATMYSSLYPGRLEGGRGGGKVAAVCRQVGGAGARDWSQAACYAISY